MSTHDQAPHEYWQITSRIGHVAEIKALLGLEPSKPVYRTIQRQGENRLDARYPIFWGG